MFISAKQNPPTAALDNAGSGEYYFPICKPFMACDDYRPTIILQLLYEIWLPT